MSNRIAVDFYVHRPGPEGTMCFDWEKSGLSEQLVKDGHDSDECGCHCRHLAREIYEDLMKVRLKWSIVRGRDVHRKNAFYKHVLCEHLPKLRAPHADYDGSVTFPRYLIRKNITSLEAYDALITLMNCNCCERHNTNKPDMSDLWNYVIENEYSRHRWITSKKKVMPLARKIVRFGMGFKNVTDENLIEFLHAFNSCSQIVPNLRLFAGLSNASNS